MKFGQLIDVHHSEAYITPRHEEWLRKNPNAKYNAKALAFLAEEYAKVQRDRSESFSASGMGKCPRAAQFQYLGKPQAPITDPKTVSIFHNGTFMHTRWQAAGLSEGWLAQPEVFVSNTDWMLKGTLDGILDNGWGLELKSINSNGYRGVLEFGAKREHKAQVDSYFLMCPDIDTFCLIYENKDTQDYKEIILHRDQEQENAMKEKMLTLMDKTNKGEYFEIRDDCWKKEGYVWRSCPYAKICHQAGDTFDI